MKQSINARKIDREYQLRRDVLIRKFKREHCVNCKNKDTDLCSITMTIDNKVKCVEYERNNKI